MKLPGSSGWTAARRNRVDGTSGAPPFSVMTRPDISQPDCDFLGLKSADDVFLLNIVTVGPRGNAMVNLRSPLVINRHTLTGKQCVPANVSTFKLQHSLHQQSAAAA